MSYATVLDALSQNDLKAARDLLLAQILEKTATRNSWDCPHYTVDPAIQQSVKIDPSRNAMFTYFGLENMRDRYFLTDASGEICENP